VRNNTRYGFSRKLGYATALRTKPKCVDFVPNARQVIIRKPIPKYPETIPKLEATSITKLHYLELGFIGVATVRTDIMDMYCLNFRNPLIDNALFKKMEGDRELFSKNDDSYYSQKDWPTNPGGMNAFPAYKDLSDRREGAELGEETILQYTGGKHEGVDHSRTSCRFEQELSQAHRARVLKKEKNEDCVKIGRVIETYDQTAISQLETPDMSLRKDQNHLNKSSKQLRKELLRTGRLLQCERSQKNALKERLEHIEVQFEELRKTKSFEKPVPGSHDDRIHKLKEQLHGYQTELEEAKTKGEKMQEEFNGLRKENKKLKEKMTVMMFNHIPSKSPKFRDVGAVNLDVKESFGRVGRYKLGRKLGEGHYGTVQVGMNDASKKTHAIKILNKERITRFKDLQQVALEVHVLKNYLHQNIVCLHEVIHAPEKIYLITELCQMDLHKYHNDIGLTEEGAKQIILGVLKPIQFLHSHGICHLDLKPENILLDQSADLDNLTHENVRLCDFGLVNMAVKPEQSQEIIRKGYACGTPGFFAPEMILKNEFEGRLADMWSLGCIVLEITLGFTQEWIESYERIEPEPKEFKDGLEGCLTDISRERYPLHQNLLDIIHRCLSIDPSRRINSSDALSHPWLEEITMADEYRQDFTNTRQAPIDPSAAYTERSKLMEAAVFC
jgi:regulator of replication initiation timing